MQTKFISASLLLAAAGIVQAKQLQINNWCGDQVTVVQSVGGGADQFQFNIPASNGKGDLHALPYTNNIGTSVKISRAGKTGVLQFEYTNAPDTFWWDLSDLDGSGAGLVGTPFANDNVKVSPTGAGEGQGTCTKIRCPAGKLCTDAYQHPDDKDTRSCPANTGDVFIDLCQPQGGFNSRKRELSDKHLRRHATKLQQ